MIFHSYVYQRVSKPGNRQNHGKSRQSHPSWDQCGVSVGNGRGQCPNSKQTGLMGMITTTDHWMVMSWWSFFMCFPFLNSFSRNISKMTFAAYRTPPACSSAVSQQSCWSYWKHSPCMVPLFNSADSMVHIPVATSWKQTVFLRFQIHHGTSIYVLRI